MSKRYIYTLQKRYIYTLHKRYIYTLQKRYIYTLRLRGTSMIQSLTHLISRALTLVTADGFIKLFHLHITCVNCNVISFSFQLTVVWIASSLHPNCRVGQKLDHFQKFVQRIFTCSGMQNSLTPDKGVYSFIDRMFYYYRSYKPLKAVHFWPTLYVSTNL